MRRFRGGFTIVEILIAISILGVLATIVFMGFNRYQADARDNERKSKATIIVEYLEKYYDENGEYPSCDNLTDPAATVRSDVLVGIEEQTLVTPYEETDDNSIQCTDLTNPSQGDWFAYVGDPSNNCTGVGGTACVTYILKYKEETTGSIVSLSSRRTTGLAFTDAPGLSTAATGFNSISADWENIDGATDYDIQRADDDAFTTNVVSQNVSVSSASLTGLSYGTSYYFRVRANNAVDSGDWSNITNSSTWSLSAPSGVSATGNVDSIDISWTSVLHSDSYTIEYDDNSSFTSPTSDTSATESYNLGSLSQGITRYFRIKATATAATSDSDWSSTVSAVTTVPTPTGLALVVNSSSQITASWDAEAAAETYTIEYDTDSGFGTSTLIEDITTTSQAITGLNQGQLYYVRVYAVVGSTPSDPSSAVSDNTTIDTPSSPSFSGVTISGTASSTSSHWLPGLPPYSGTWYVAKSSSPSSSCPTGTTAQYRYRGEYETQTQWYGWTSWGGSTYKYMVRPNYGSGVRIQIQVRCYTEHYTSSESSSTSRCAWRDGSTSCTGF